MWEDPHTSGVRSVTVTEGESREKRGGETGCFYTELEWLGIREISTQTSKYSPNKVLGKSKTPRVRKV